MPRTTLSLLLLLPFLGGCGENGDTASTTLSPPTQPVIQQDDEIGPVQAVQTVLTGIQDGQADVVWEYLPPTFQTELEKLVQDFGTSMEPEIWKRAFATLQRLLDVARKQKTLLIKNPALNLEQFNQAQLNDSWDAVIDLIEILVKGELSDLQRPAIFQRHRDSILGTAPKALGPGP